MTRHRLRTMQYGSDRIVLSANYRSAITICDCDTSNRVIGWKAIFFKRKGDFFWTQNRTQSSKTKIYFQHSNWYFVNTFFSSILFIIYFEIQSRVWIRPNASLRARLRMWNVTAMPKPLVGSKVIGTEPAQFSSTEKNTFKIFKYSRKLSRPKTSSNQLRHRSESPSETDGLSEKNYKQQSVRERMSSPY